MTRQEIADLLDEKLTRFDAEEVPDSTSEAIFIHVGQARKMREALRIGPMNDTKAPTLVEAAFLLDRLSEFEARLTNDDASREFFGHIAPSAARLRAALATYEAAEGSGEATVTVPREMMERALRSASLLQQNAEGCAVNHHAADFEIQGLPGWLQDTARDLREAREALATPSRARQAEGREDDLTDSPTWRDGKCYECGVALVGPYCPACNPVDDATPSPPSVTLELSESERHELECLRARVQQIEYPCSPHCDGYLRELALRNTTPVAPASARLDRVEIARIIWNRFAPSHALEFPGAVGEWGSLADAIIALARSARGEG